MLGRVRYVHFGIVVQLSSAC